MTANTPPTFLCIGDTVNWTATIGLPPRQATVVDIRFNDQPGNQRLTAVRWKFAHSCIIMLDNGKVVNGETIEHSARTPYKFPDNIDRCN